MDIRMPKGFKVVSVDMYFMKTMEHVKCTMGLYETENGIIARKNEIPTGNDVSVVGDVLIGGVGMHLGDDDTLYEFPVFTDNVVDHQGNGFTVLTKSELSKKEVETLFEKL